MLLYILDHYLANVHANCTVKKSVKNFTFAIYTPSWVAHAKPLNSSLSKALYLCVRLYTTVNESPRL